MSAQPAAADQAPKKKGKLILIISLALVVLGGGGGGAAWFFMRGASHDAPAAPPPEKPAVFMPLETFTVNLVPAEGQPQYLQAGLTLKLGANIKEEKVKERMPEIRDRVLMVLSAKKATDVLSVAGKQRLQAELSATIQRIVGGAPAAHGAPVAVAAPVVQVAQVTPVAVQVDAHGQPIPVAPAAAVQVDAHGQPVAAAPAAVVQVDAHGQPVAVAPAPAAVPMQAALPIPAPVAPGNAIEVLFTSFIVQ